ncbi:hypothetical protein [Halobacterium bonnevillei]|uniref:Uncharacterized protein n=1 Tax=Halobacterium bonnevillei TaxID=2692200 RepID=A0A6B0SJI3_9EURY|nr:hypothetical protein [Halobacterium bonnevillei]MXR21347.1 hypothetical protein [Halobacterium bonnevillei]
MSLRRHRVEDAVADAVVRVLRPSARRVLVSALATAWTTWTRWRTWTTSAGRHPDEAVEHHFYWPAYEWSHTDFVVGPSSLGLVLTFLVGVALWYLPVSVVDASLQMLGQWTGLRQRVRSVAPSGGRIAWWLDDRWHPFGLVALVAFSLPASLLPPQSPFSLFTYPGIVAVLDVAGHLGTERYLTDRMVGLVVPASYLCWYVAGAIGWIGYRWLRS